MGYFVHVTIKGKMSIKVIPCLSITLDRLPCKIIHHPGPSWTVRLRVWKIELLIHDNTTTIMKTWLDYVITLRWTEKFELYVPCKDTSATTNSVSVK